MCAMPQALLTWNCALHLAVAMPETGPQLSRKKVLHLKKLSR